MNNTKSLLVALLVVGAGPAAWADAFSTGTNDLAHTNLSGAYANLAAAVKASPNDPGANVYFAFTRLLSIPNGSAMKTFLSDWGLSAAGRDVYDWTARPHTDAGGTIEFPGGQNVDSVTAVTRSDVLPILAGAETNLAHITDTTFTLFMPHTVTHPHHGSYLDGGVGDVTLDYGDVQMLRAGLEAEVFQIYNVHSWNVDGKVSAISNYEQIPDLTSGAGKEGIEGVLKKFPDAFTFATTNDFKAAREAFTNAINDYLAASQFIRSRPPGTLRLFNLQPDDLAREQEFRTEITELEESLVAPVAFKGNPNHMVSMEAYFKAKRSPRSLLPQITNGTDFVWDSEPDPTFGGVVTGLTASDLSKHLISRKGKGINAELIEPGYNFTDLRELPDVDYSGPPNGVVEGRDGNLYGTFSYGGAKWDGYIFKYAPSTGVLTRLHQFGMETDADGNPMDGAHPNNLILGSDGNLYGTTAYGGGYGNGTVFVISPKTGKLTNLWDFGTVADGYAYAPTTALAQGTDGGFYGTTSQGGPNGNGIIFRLSLSPADTAPNFSMLHAFDSQTNMDAANPNALLVGMDGNLYGTALTGGANNFGAIFEVSSPGVDNNYALLYSFGSQQDQFGNPLDGSAPNALVQGSDGFLYGTTLFGGSNDTNYFSYSGYFWFSPDYYQSYSFTGDGTIFRMDTGGDFTNLYSFDQNQFDGFTPVGAMARGTNGTLYGVTYGGGANNRGTIFAYKPGGIPQFVVWLSKGLGGGPRPPNSLVTSPTTGSFYGTTATAHNGSGTIYRFKTGGGSGPASRLPAIVTEPKGEKVLQGDSVQLTVTASNAATYQWRSNSVALTDGGNISGSSSEVLVINPALTSDSGKYSVIVANDSGSRTSSVVTVTVEPEGKPSVKITSPANHARGVAPVVFGGTASDPVVVESVNYWITNRDGAWFSGQADLFPGKGAVSNWSLTLRAPPLAPGSNVLTVRSMNFSGNASSPATLDFFLETPSLLTLSTNGIGTVSGKASFAGDIRPTNNAPLNVGESYSLTATPAASWRFTNWTVGTGAGFSNVTKNPLVFVMEPEMSIRANFTNEYFQYNGLFSVSGESPTLETAGLIGNLLVSPNGHYNGKLYFQGDTYSLRGSFDPSGAATNLISRKEAAGGPMNLSMTNLNRDNVWDGTQETIRGTVSGADKVVLAGATNQGWASSFTLTLSPLSSVGSGVYTMLIAPPGSAAAPPGYGYLLLTNNGDSMKLTGTLADGTVFTQATWIAEDGTVPVYGSLYAKNIGMLFGRVGLGGADSGTLTWLKKPSSQAKYPDGITNAATNVSAYVWPVGLALDNFIADGSQLVISGPGLAEPLTSTISVTGTNLGFTGGSGNFVSGSINPKTGQLQITFHDDKGAKVKGHGAVIVTNTPLAPGVGFGGGYFPGATNAGSIILRSP